MDIRSAFLNTKLKEEEVVIPELGGITVFIREMDARRFDQYESMIYETDEDGKIKANVSNMSAKLVICSVFDFSGNQVFSPDDVEELSKRNGKLIKRLADKAAAISGLYSEEKAEKN